MWNRESRRADRVPTRNYPRVLRAALLWCALLLALLPLPVTWFRLLPVYETHARFLAIYAPVVCLLLLAYLLYIRDALARLMFANILNPLPETDPYYRMSAAETVQRWLRQAQAAVLALLPVVLLAASFYCLVRYTDRLRFSASAAAAATSELPAAGEEVGRVSEAPHRAPDVPVVAPPVAPVEAVVSPARDQILNTAGIDAIPMFTELTVLYIGIFAAAMIAVILMALKEHAKEAMGLSEQEMVMGRYVPPEDGLPGTFLALPGSD